MCSDVFMDLAAANMAALELFATQLQSQLIQAGVDPKPYNGPRLMAVWDDPQLAQRAVALRERVCAHGQYLISRGLAHCGHGDPVRGSNPSGGEPQYV